MQKGLRAGQSGSCLFKCSLGWLDCWKDNWQPGKTGNLQYAHFNRLLIAKRGNIGMIHIIVCEDSDMFITR